MRRGVLPLLIALVPAAVAAQSHPLALDGVLSGVVRDRSGGAPVPYALVSVVGARQQVFASDAGRFRLTGLRPGRISIRVRQIGYKAIVRSLVLESVTSAAIPTPELVVLLDRQPLQLPELTANPDACPALRDMAAASEDAATVLDRALENAERILAIERDYPFVLDYQLATTEMDSTYSIVGGTIDTVRRESRRFDTYRQGRVLERRGNGVERINAFTTSSIAGAAFQESHCFWYGGRDSIAGFQGYRIDFAPRADIRTPDWAGSILIDSVTLGLLRTEARVVNLPERGTSFLSVICSIFYRPLAPSLPQEHEARCVSGYRGPPRHYRVERWLLVNRTFVQRTPGEPSLPDRR